MARPEFNDFVNVRQTVAAPGPNSDVMIVERFQGKTLQVHGLLSGTYKVQGTVGDHDDWADVPGLGVIAADGIYEITLTVKKLRVVTTADAAQASDVPKVTFGGFDMRTDGA